MAIRTASLILAAAALAAPALALEPFKLDVDQTVTLKLTGVAESIVLGNASIADVTVSDTHTLLVSGRSTGVTNLIVMDRAGRAIYRNEIHVSEEVPGQLTIVRGGGTYSYSCISKCRPSPQAGDNPGHFAEAVGTIQGKAALTRGQ